MKLGVHIEARFPSFLAVRYIGHLSFLSHDVLHLLWRRCRFSFARSKELTASHRVRPHRTFNDRHSPFTSHALVNSRIHDIAREQILTYAYHRCLSSSSASKERRHTVVYH